MVTAKVHCSMKTTTGEDENGFTRLEFIPDYADGRNQEWAVATPHLSLVMTVKNGVADRFETGKAYTLQFVEDDD